MKNLLGNMALACCSILFTLIAAEFFLSFMPVSGVSRTQPLHLGGTGFDVSSVRHGTVTYSDSWNFRNPVRKKTNNYGFFSHDDYEPGAPVIVAIGDSYTEAAQVAFPGTYHQIAAKAIGKTIYNFAISGSPLSQYEAFLADSCKHFRPTAAVFAVIHNDFDESFRRYRARDGFFHYSDEAPVTLAPTQYHISALRHWITKSNLVRYLFFNLNMRHHVRQLTSGSAATHKVSVSFSGASDVNADVKRRAIDLFLQRITDYCVPKEKIVFLLDGDRKSIYEGIARRDVNMIYFRNQARSRGFRVIDLQQHFANHYKARGQMFETESDSHWNPLGHQVVGEALAGVLKDPLYHQQFAQQTD